jgi:hypothetical protein
MSTCINFSNSWPILVDQSTLSRKSTPILNQSNVERWNWKKNPIIQKDLKQKKKQLKEWGSKLK